MPSFSFLFLTVPEGKNSLIYYVPNYVNRITLLFFFHVKDIYVQYIMCTFRFPVPFFFCSFVTTFYAVARVGWPGRREADSTSYLFPGHLRHLVVILV